MRALELAAVGLCLLGMAFAFQDCPSHCTCTQSSFIGGRAKCTQLDPGRSSHPEDPVQKFPIDIIHLVVHDYPDERLPANIFKDVGLQRLLTLRLVGGALRHVNKDAFQGLNDLEDIHLSDNQIERLDPHTFEPTKSLKRLNLNGNPLSLLDPNQPKESRHFLLSDTLIELTLSRCKITSDQVSALSNLINLEFLDLSNNLLKELKDDMFSSLSNLEDVNLSYNQISHIDRDTFADIDEMATLNLRGNPLRTLEGIEIPGLKELDVSQCKFEVLAASTLEGFPELSFLNMSQNSILNIDMDTFMSVPSLKNLDLSYNRLRGPLSELLFEFNKRLETLSFRGNMEIKYMPGFKGEFPLLYLYDISKCGLTSIGNDTFKGMNYLATVNVSGNSLVHIDPKTFVMLQYLTSLDLSSNLLQFLHSKIFISNQELGKLNLAKNYFKHLPAVLFQFTPKLHWLDVSNCRLTTLWNISESLQMRNRNILSKLSYLNLSGNKLTKLHKHYFISMERLEKLDISNNPIECTPDFSHVMQWLIINHVVPNKTPPKHHLTVDLIENNVQWDEVLKAVCPVELTTINSQPEVFYIPEQQYGSQEGENEGGIEIPIIAEEGVWPMIFIWASICTIFFALVNMIALLIFRAKRNYKVLGYRPQFSSTLDGHFQVRRGGRPLYQKLYEECSVPAPIHNDKKVRIVTILGNKLGSNKNNVDV